MRPSEEEVHAITPEGIEEREALGVQVWQRKLGKELAVATIQLRCKCCNRPQTREQSRALIEEWQKQNQIAYEGGEIMLTYDQGRHDEVMAVDPCECGGDRFEAMRKGRRRKREEVQNVPF
jgi:hypothetical protein